MKFLQGITDLERTIMKKLLLLPLLLFALAVFAVTPEYAAAPSPATPGILECKASDWLGGAKVNIGIKGEKLEYVGNPNSLNRCDRVVFSLDIRQYIYDGKVRTACLEYMNMPMRQPLDNEIALELLVGGRSRIRPEDLIASDTAEVCRYPFIAPQTPQYLKIDVTTFVNQALSVGDGTSTFRLRNITTETRGNPGSQAEGITVPRGSVRLLITPVTR